MRCLLAIFAIAFSGCRVDAYSFEDVTAGYYHTCALINGDVKCWGDNRDGQLGLGHTKNIGNDPGEIQNLPYIDFGTREPVVQVSAGGYHTCALFASGRVKCWGSAHEGPLGHGDWIDDIGDEPGEVAESGFIDLGTKFRVSEISAGAQHVCAIFSNGAVKCWGYNYFGQLGLGDHRNRGARPGEMGTALPFVALGMPAKQIRAGDGHTCAVLENDRVKCWGANNFGQLGLGDPDNRGDEPGEMGHALPFVDLGAGITVRKVVAHYEHTCALLTDGRVKCWGDNKFGQLGLGDSTNRGFYPEDMGDNLPFVDFGEGLLASQIDLGYGYTCALLDHGMKCVGYNSDGRMGYDFMNQWGKERVWGWHPSDMGDNLPYVDLGTVDPIVTFATGDSHTCVLFYSDRMKCFGYAEFGEIASGDRISRGDNPSTMGVNLQWLPLAP